MGIPPEEELATYSSILAWKNPMPRGAWQGRKESDTTEQLSKSIWVHMTHEIKLVYSD